MASTIQEKLKKILDLRENAGTEGEAKAAAAMLARLLAKHNLEISDLEGIGAAVAPELVEGINDIGKGKFEWKFDLADTIAEFYYCYSLSSKYDGVKFAGRPENVTALNMLYSWLVEQIRVIARKERKVHIADTGEHIDGLRWQISFGKGAVSRLGEMLRKKQREDQDAAGTALVRHHGTEISDYLEKTRGYRVDGQKTKAEQECDAKWEARIDKRKALKAKCKAAGDMEPFYVAYPSLRPATDEQKEIDAAYWEKEAKKDAARERRNAKRRDKYAEENCWRDAPREKAVDYRKLRQQSTAEDSGYAAGNQINLEPFIEGPEVTGTDQQLNDEGSN